MHRERAVILVCLTLANAATIHHHTDPTGTAVRGYTSTSHHAGHLTPGDWWQPVPDQPPRTVTDIHRRHGVITLTDQHGSTWTCSPSRPPPGSSTGPAGNGKTGTPCSCAARCGGNPLGRVVVT